MDSMPVLNYECLYEVYMYKYLRDTKEQENHFYLMSRTRYPLSSYRAHISLGASVSDAVARC